MDQAEDLKQTTGQKTEEAKSGVQDTTSAAKNKASEMGGGGGGGGFTDDAKKKAEEAKKQGGGMMDQAGQKFDDAVGNIKQGMS